MRRVLRLLLRWRLLLGSLTVLLCSAGFGAAVVLDQVHTLRDALRQNAPLVLPSSTLAPAGWGQPQTLLLVGDDQRKLTGEFKYYRHPVLPHANEMILVRIDPAKPYISMMSIPRELEVTIYPPRKPAVTTRFNYAYTAGGIPLLVSTIKQDLGLPVNHVMVVTFGRFERAVDEMGCVYSTVDRRYYHVNLPGGPQYQEINLQPGYQNLCGKQALEFVSYRHDDTSLVRDARDQSLLLDVKQQYGSALADNIDKFERIFGQAVQTDRGLQSTTGLLNLIGTLISSSGRRVRQVKFQANIVPPAATPCECVTATPGQIAASVHDFLDGTSAPPKRAVADTARAARERRFVAQLPLSPVPAGEVDRARSAGARMPFPYEFPAVQDRGGSRLAVSLRDYSITAPDHSSYPIYVAVFSAGALGQYYDVQGTAWPDPPLLERPAQTVQVDGRTYLLQYQGATLQTVGWRERGGTYWIRNSLTGALPNGELLAIAEQTAPLTGGTGPVPGGSRRPVTLREAMIPIRVAPRASDVREELGAVSALVSILLVPLLGALVLLRRREARRLRVQLAELAAAELRLRELIAVTD
jgi:LCP family protein required for cell wall assembly